MFAEDLSVFINPDTPGYKVMQVNHDDVQGIFDDDYVEDSFSESSTPVFWAAGDNLPCLEQGDPVCDVSDGTHYQVVNTQPDGTGLTMIRLMRSD